MRYSNIRKGSWLLLTGCQAVAQREQKEINNDDLFVIRNPLAIAKVMELLELLFLVLEENLIRYLLPTLSDIVAIRAWSFVQVDTIESSSGCSSFTKHNPHRSYIYFTLK